MDRQQSRETLSRVFYSVRGHDQITLTSSINSSRRWWSRTIWPYYVVLRDGHLTIGYLLVQREEDQRKGFNLVLNPNSSKHFLYFRAIQGLSGDNFVDPALQDNVLLPEDPTEYINHIGKVSEKHSIIRSGLIPGGRSSRKGTGKLFFTTVNPMDDDQSMEKPMRLGQAEDRSIQNTWRPHPNTMYWCTIKLAQKRGFQFYQKRSHAIVLYNTLLAICTEKAVCMKTKEEPYHKEITGAPNYTEAEFEKWTTELTWSTSKNILRPPKRIAEFQGNLVRQLWLQNTWHTPFSSRTIGHESQRDTVIKLIQQFREPPDLGVFPAGLE